MVMVAYIFGKASNNQDPELSEEEEDARNKAKAKHQFWQTMDYTEPWNKR